MCTVSVFSRFTLILQALQETEKASPSKSIIFNNIWKVYYFNLSIEDSPSPNADIPHAIQDVKDYIKINCFLNSMSIAKSECLQ